MADDEEQRTIGDWTVYQDDDGRTYYYNEKTGESRWDPPPGFDENDADGVPSKVDNEADNVIMQSSPANEAAAAAAEKEGEEDGEGEDLVADGEDIGSGWVAYTDGEGRTYYYSTGTGETQWERPADIAGGEDGAGHSSAVDTQEKKNEALQKSGDQWAQSDDDEKMDDAGSPASATSPTTTTENEEAKNSTAAKAEQSLQRPDAVMEPGVIDQISILVQELGPQIAGPKAMQSLINNYSGDTAVCGLMGLWLAKLKSMASGGGESSNNNATAVPETGDGNKNDGGGAADRLLFQEGADSARDVVEEVVNRLAKERFTKDGGDAIVKLPKKEAAFIDDMIQSDRWRKLLIDLSATNKNSKLFMYCLQSISNLGHHRAIASRIDQSDYFGVFDSMLKAEYSIAAKVAVDGYTKEVANSIDETNSPVESLVANLRRTCTSTSYTYLYSIEVLNELLSNSKDMLSNVQKDKHQHPESLKRAIRKWERLHEELEDEMLKPLKTGTTFQRKRRIDVALTMSDLFQRKRRRMDPRVAADEGNNNDCVNKNNSQSDLADTLDSALWQLLTKNSLGMQIDKDIVENMLKYAYEGSTRRIGDLLIRHPTAITTLLHNLFAPSRRIRQLETRLKCARLVALAVTASERLVRSESDNQGEDIPESDEDVLSQVILKGSQSCEQLETMVSFTVLDSVDSNNDVSIGRQLCAMCIQYSVVSQGVMIWAKELARGSDFVTTASYPTISPCILSLARLICRHHPLTRSAVLDLSLIFMGHSNREISHQKMESIKEQCLRLMLWLSTQGLSLAVISAVQNNLDNGGGASEMDSALVRYFFTGMLEIIRPPFSLSFVRALGGLMMKRPCVDALLSKHFEASKREAIVQLVHQFEAAGMVQKKAMWEEDKSLLSVLKNTYCLSSSSLKNICS